MRLARAQWVPVISLSIYNMLPYHEGVGCGRRDWNKNQLCWLYIRQEFPQAGGILNSPSKAAFRYFCAAMGLTPAFEITYIWASSQRKSSNDSIIGLQGDWPTNRNTLLRLLSRFLNSYRSTASLTALNHLTMGQILESWLSPFSGKTAVDFRESLSERGMSEGLAFV